ncbi:MAG: DUF3168 domain-containing protein [Rhodobacteraceae bacterium]|nr:DUF3168 domain-containing protein [Paracoccaceae bacterium]
MSYAISAALQAAVYQRLQSDAALAGLVGGAIFDALPTGTLPHLYVTLGPEQVRDRSDNSGYGAQHTLTISVVSDTAGFGAAKAAAGAVSDALHGADLTLSRGRLIALTFERATARHSGRAGRVRHIDLRFRARVEDNH